MVVIKGFMLMPSMSARVFSVGMMVLGTGAVYGQEFPNKPIRIVAPGPGGQSDFAARLIAQELTESLPQQVIVDSRPAGVVPGEVVFRSPPDGYTLLVSGNNLWITPLFQKTPYDPLRDFSPISLTNRQPNILVVHPSLPVKSVRELIALARARPGELNYTSAATGSSSHIAAELFKYMTGVNIVRIPYKTSATEMADLVGGHVQLTFGTTASVLPHVKSGKLRALAVTSAQTSVLFPDLPTVAASGVPGYEAGSMAGLFAPAKTPEAIINRLNQDVVRVLNKADVKERFFRAGVETVGSSVEELSTVMKSEVARLSKVIKDADIRAD